MMLTNDFVGVSFQCIFALNPEQGGIKTPKLVAL